MQQAERGQSDWPSHMQASIAEFVRKPNIIDRLRATLADRLGIRDEASKNGLWWEIDLIMVILAGAIAAGILAFVQL